jgi:iron complex transport system permease protein
MRYPALILVLVLLFAGAVVLSLATGPGGLGADGILIHLRWLRTGCAALAGAALAVAGVLVQGLFRNPLASPDVVGTTAGATLGGQLVLVGHAALAASLPAWLAPELLLPLGCLAGAAAALALLLTIAGRGRAGEGLVAVLLTGFVITAVVGACSGLLTALVAGRWELSRALAAFGLGGVDGKGPGHIGLAAPLVAAGMLAAWAWGRTCDLLLAGEEEAAALGVDVGRARRWLLAWTALLAAAAVAVGGALSFVGLVVPHALRPFAGVGHRRLVPAAALGGAAFLVLCDVAARGVPWCLRELAWVPGAGELPLGVVTGLIGGPVFLLLLVRARREGTLA